MQTDTPYQDSERLLVLLSYGLFLVAPPMGGLTGVIAVIIAHMRAGHAQGSWLESHYRNQIRVFWTMLAFALVMMCLVGFGMGFSAFTLFWPFTPGWAFWTGLGVGMSWAFFLPMLGILSLILVIWYYWRLLRGFVCALDDKPY